MNIKGDAEAFFGEGIGVIGGLFGAKYLGNFVEDSFAKNGGITGYLFNNLSKVVAGMLIGKVGGRGFMGDITQGAKEAIAASVILDTYTRITGKHLINSLSDSLSNIDMQQFRMNMQENNNLKIQLNNALARMNSPNVPTIAPTIVPPVPTIVPTIAPPVPTIVPTIAPMVPVTSIQPPIVNMIPPMPVYDPTLPGENSSMYGFMGRTDRPDKIIDIASMFGML